MSRVHLSPYTLEFSVDGTLYLFNTLSGALDRLTDKASQEEWRLLKSTGSCSPALVDALKERGYAYDDPQEEAALLEKLMRKE